jgi:hypothetical protein
MVSVAGAALGAVAIVAATVLEELTHLVAGRPFAVEQRLERRLHVVQEVPEDAPAAVDKWIALAPFLVGLTALALVIAGRGVPPLSDETVLFWVAWAWFTCPSLGDLKAASGNGDYEPQDWSDPRLRAVWAGGTIQSIGMLLTMGVDELVAVVAAHAPQYTLYAHAYALRAGILISLAGCLWIFIRLELIERELDKAGSR